MNRILPLTNLNNLIFVAINFWCVNVPGEGQFRKALEKNHNYKELIYIT